MLSMLTGHWRARAIHAARLGIADILSGGPLPAEEVARLLVADPDAIARFLRFLSHIGVLRVDSSLRYGIGTIGGLLRIDNPFHDVVRLYGEEFHQAWDNLLPARVVIEPGLADWLTLCPVDFFVEVPAGHDVYLLARVLRDWINEGYVRILRVCRQACGPAAVILIVERLLPDLDTESLAIAWDTQMLTITGGRERNSTEYAELLFVAGFHISEVHALPLDMKLPTCFPH